MNDRLCYSLSSNWLVRSEMFDRKKHLTELELMNRFRKMHLYDAIHSLSGKKLHKNSKTQNTQFLQHHSSSTKNITQSKPHKKQPLPFNTILIQQKDDHQQNKQIKLKHFNPQKSRPQTFSKLPTDSSKQAINRLLYEQSISSRKRELIVRAEKVLTNNDRSQGQQRLSIKLSSKSGANEYNTALQQCTAIDYNTIKQPQKRIKKWQTSYRQQSIQQDLNRVRLSNIDSYQTRTTKQRQQDEQQYEIGRWSSHYNNQSQQQLRQTQLSQVDEEEFIERDQRYDIISNNHKNTCHNDDHSNIIHNSNCNNNWRMSLIHHHKDYAVQIKKKHQYPHPKKEQHQQQQQKQKQHHHNNNNHKNVKFIVDNIIYTPKYSLTNFKSHPHLETDNTNIGKNHINDKEGSIVRKNFSLQKLRPLTGDNKTIDKQNIIQKLQQK